jgi:hypothetical protein
MTFMRPEGERINATQNISSRLAEEAQKQRKDPLHGKVPPEFHEFEDVFSKASFDELPP